MRKLPSYQSPKSYLQAVNLSASSSGSQVAFAYNHWADYCYRANHRKDNACLLCFHRLYEGIRQYRTQLPMKTTTKPNLNKENLRLLKLTYNSIAVIENKLFNTDLKM